MKSKLLLLTSLLFMFFLLTGCVETNYGFIPGGGYRSLDAQDTDNTKNQWDPDRVRDALEENNENGASEQARELQENTEIPSSNSPEPTELERENTTAEKLKEMDREIGWPTPSAITAGGIDDTDDQKTKDANKVQDAINGLPAQRDLNFKDMERINEIAEMYDELSKEQQELVDDSRLMRAHNQIIWLLNLRQQ